MYDGSELIKTKKEVLDEVWQDAINIYKLRKQDVRLYIGYYPQYKNISVTKDDGGNINRRIHTIRCGPLATLDWQSFDATGCSKSNGFLRKELTFIYRFIEIFDMFDSMKQRVNRANPHASYMVKIPKDFRNDVKYVLKSICIDNRYFSSVSRDIFEEILKDRIAEKNDCKYNDSLTHYKLNDIDNVPGSIRRVIHCDCMVTGVWSISYYKVDMY